jgi:predicted permease
MTVEKFPKGMSLAEMQDAQFGPKVRPLKRDVVGDVGNVLWVLLGTVGLVLLIACANVANLFLVRADGRQREIALRTAMGADRVRLAREFFLESITLGLLGGIVGVVLAFFGIRLLVAIGPESVPRLHTIAIDPMVLAFTLSISLFAGLLFGLIPILRYGSPNLPNLSAALKEGGRGSGDGRDRHRARSALVVSQVALALVLLVGSGLMFRSFQALRSVHPGFVRPDEVLTLKISIPEAEIEDPTRAVRTHEQIVRRIEQIPGVDSVGLSSSITMDGWDSNDGVHVEDFPTPEGQIPTIRRFKWISANYFETMGNPVLAGRPLSWTDAYNLSTVAVVTENFATEYWNTPEDALGKRIRQSPDKPWREIVGVVGNIHDDGVAEEATATVFWPMLQRDFWNDDLEIRRTMGYAIRTSRVGTAVLLDEIRTTVWSINANLPIASVVTLQELLDDSMARTAFTLIMLGIASAVALVLGAVGIYGVISYAVSQRTREIGVRMALGARRSDVANLVLREGVVLTGIGLLVGLAFAVGLTRLMSSLLFGVNPIDLLTYALVSLTLAAIALLASYIPARRAASIHPTEALRWE